MNMNKKEKRKDYLSSLKSIETENIIDRVFYRPVGYKIAKALQNTGITPNTITVISIFIGVSAGIAWYFPYDLGLAILGVAALIFANILDCVDGQLARLTGIKSEIGRILDGVAGDLWFLSIYIALAHRLSVQYADILSPWYFVILILLSGLSHLGQASQTDYYKTLHLFFISNEKGKEFENSGTVIKRYETMPRGIGKVATWAYIYYTKYQEKATPRLQHLLSKLHIQYGGMLPERVREKLREGSLKLMPLLDFSTFNGRSIVLFISVIFNVVWFYFVWEVVVLNILKWTIKRRHENFCREVIGDFGTERFA